MKNIFRLSFLLAFGLVILASCAKKPEPAPSPGGTTSSMSGTFGGTAWTAASIKADTSTGLLVVSGVSSVNTSVVLSIPENIVAGSYDASGGVIQVEYFYDANNYYFLSAGSVKISSNAGGVIGGSFSGTMTNPNTNATIPATGASFTVKYK